MTARELGRDLLQYISGVDPKVSSTGLSLLVPGQLTIEYLRGRRARHVRPLTLFLFLAGIEYLAFHRNPETTFRVVSEQFKTLDEPAPTDGNAILSDIRERLRPMRQWLKARAMAHPDRLRQVADLIESRDEHAAALTYLAGVALATRRRRLLLSEHLVFVLHLQSFWALLAVVSALGAFPSNMLMAFSVVYDAVAFHRVYQFGLWGTAWRFPVAVLVQGLGMSAARTALAVSLLW